MNWKALAKAVGTLLLALFVVFVVVGVFTYISLHFGSMVIFVPMAFCSVVAIILCFWMAIRLLYDLYNK